MSKNKNSVVLPATKWDGFAKRLSAANRDEVMVWLEAAVVANAKFDGNASAYCRAAGKQHPTHKKPTANALSAALLAVGKYGTPAQAFRALTDKGAVGKQGFVTVNSMRAAMRNQGRSSHKRGGRVSKRARSKQETIDFLAKQGIRGESATKVLAYFAKYKVTA